MSTPAEPTLMEFIALRIRDLRNGYGGKGLSQEALAKELGVATNTVSRWETGTYKPSIEDLEQLARFFGVSILEFFPKEDEQVNDEISALMRTAKQLLPPDLEELRRYAEFRRARHMLGAKPVGRKRKQTK
jgi:transcriptional regulator with XRE-family HTH domain